MADHRIAQVRRLVRQGKYSLSSHVFDELAQDEFTLSDVEYSVLLGRCVETQRDEQRVAVDGRKYTIRGRTSAGLPFETIGKIICGHDGNEYFFITAYEWK